MAAPTCTFDSPQLPKLVGGVAPTFAFNTANSNFFGVTGSWTSGSSVCSFPTKRGLATQTVTPYLVIPTTNGLGATGKSTVTCNPKLTPLSTNALSSSTTYPGFQCTNAPSVGAWIPGTYTISFAQSNGAGYASFASNTFIVAKPTTMTDFVISTTTLSETLSAGPSTTKFVTQFSATSLSTTTLAADPANTVTSPDYTSTATVTETLSPSEYTTSTETEYSATITSTSLLAAEPSGTFTDTQYTATSTEFVTSYPPAQEPNTVTDYVNECPTTSTSAASTSEAPTTSSTSSDATTATSDASSTSTSTSTTDTTTSAPTSTLTVSTDGPCGGTTGQTCKNSVFGNCCSAYGYCGSSDTHCGKGCQVGFGDCNAPSTTPVVSDDGSCGGTTGQTCKNSVFGNCCSKYGFCGSSDGHCGVGCQSGFGDCNSADPTNPPVSTDGSCGGADGMTCKNSVFGTCCSKSGYCGTGDAYCGTGCQSGFGDCNTVDPTTPSVSTDGTCGGSGGQTCKGSVFGSCCSASGYCGSTDAYCGASCQKGFGDCNTPISQDGACGGDSGQTCQGSIFGDCCSQHGYCGSGLGYCDTGCQSAFGTCSTGQGAKVRMVRRELYKRAVQGPDYTYPPIPHTTKISSTMTETTTITPTAAGVKTETIFTITSDVVTETASASGTKTVMEPTDTTVTITETPSGIVAKKTVTTDYITHVTSPADPSGMVSTVVFADKTVTETTVVTTDVPSTVTVTATTCSSAPGETTTV